MSKTPLTREQIKHYAQLSPFELKNVFIDLAKDVQADKPGQKGTSSVQMLNAGRGNPNWVATGPREAFHAVGHFALAESRRVWTADNLGGMPEKEGAYERFDTFVRTHPDLPGIELLAQCVQLGVQRFGFDKDSFVHELADSSIGDNYPVPDRILAHVQEIVRGYIADEMFDKKPPAGDISYFATEGGTAAMCYIFDSLMKNGILHKGDKIALMVPVFTPYIEIPELDTYEFDVTYVEASMFAETGVREWRYPEEEVAKLADPEIKQGFRSIAADLPRNTLLVYSYSKHYGCTGWRLGVIGLHDDNVIDEMLAKLPAADKERLNRRYGTLTLEPEKIRFIDRLVADSRQVALNHTAGLSLPQQVMLALFSLFDMLEEGQAYKLRIRAIVQQRLELLLEGSQMKVADDPQRAGYYIELDLLAQAQLEHGEEFAAYLQKTYEPVDTLFRPRWPTSTTSTT